MILFVTVAAILIAIIIAAYDKTMIDSNSPIKYRGEYAVRAILLLLVSVFNIPLFILAVVVFWITFDLALNRMMCMEWLYIGHRSPVDKFVRKYLIYDSYRVYLYVKAIALFAASLWAFGA